MDKKIRTNSQRTTTYTRAHGAGRGESPRYVIPRLHDPTTRRPSFTRAKRAENVEGRRTCGISIHSGEEREGGGGPQYF